MACLEKTLYVFGMLLSLDPACWPPGRSLHQPNRCPAYSSHQNEVEPFKHHNNVFTYQRAHYPSDIKFDDKRLKGHNDAIHSRMH